MTTRWMKVIGLVLMLSACGGGDGDDDAALPNYSGEWDVTYNVLMDAEVKACNWFVAPTVPGFTDLHTILQDGSALHLTSQIGIVDADGAVDESGALKVEELQSGDIYGDGSYCEAEFAVTYESLEDGRADTLFHQIVACDDGYTCEDRAVGSAVRRPE